MSDVRLIDPIFEDDDHAVVACFDEPGAGGACHRYGVVAHPEAPNREMVYANIKFQEGPVENNEWNGCQMEDLLLIIRDRLQGFQSGKFACRENALALTKIEEALHWLNHRTARYENERDS